MTLLSRRYKADGYGYLTNKLPPFFPIPWGGLECKVTVGTHLEGKKKAEELLAQFIANMTEAGLKKREEGAETSWWGSTRSEVYVNSMRDSIAGYTYTPINGQLLLSIYAQN